eukprot:1188076-Prorocentrum_minimum.AAC.2
MHRSASPEYTRNILPGMRRASSAPVPRATLHGELHDGGGAADAVRVRRHEPQHLGASRGRRRQVKQREVGARWHRRGYPRAPVRDARRHLAGAVVVVEQPTRGQLHLRERPPIESEKGNIAIYSWSPPIESEKGNIAIYSWSPPIESEKRKYSNILLESANQIGKREFTPGVPKRKYANERRDVIATPY